MPRQLFHIAAALSLAIAIASASLWCCHNNTSHSISIQSRRLTLRLSQTNDGFTLFWELLNRAATQVDTVGTAVESYFQLVVLFLTLPAAWVIWRLRQRRALRSNPSASVISLDPHHRRWAITVLLLGVLGLPAYAGLLFACETVFWPILVIEVIFVLLVAIGFPFCAMCFIYGKQARWKGDWVGDLGAFLTVTWVAYIIDVIIHSILYT